MTNNEANGDNPSLDPTPPPTGSQTFNGLFPFRERANSKRARVSSSDNPQDLSFDLFSELTTTISKIRIDLEKQTLNKNGIKNDKDKFLTPISNGLDTIENRLSDIARFCFNLSSSHSTLLTRVEKLESTISVNVASGDLVSDIEKSATYKDLCNQTMNSNLLSKIPNLDMGTPTKLDRPEMIDSIKSKLYETLPPNSLKDVIITPLSKETHDKEGKNIIPVLLKSKDKDTRFKLDKVIKDNNFALNYHWPKDLVPYIRQIRTKVSKIANDNLNLANKQILVRPSITGKSLYISYRDDFNKPWITLESVKTPATSSMLKNTKFTQPCVSKFFVIENTA